ncbi:zinc ribbon domain-containing protein [Zophobihabitans entericus]|uniref:AraC family transcriptional regulator n=1 Tax=Zophobihabitans entericus TaxID=1635327 RepID=A0A6G9IAU6_9GAMM|nr:zinc ribbon domain-containing protein [Zophobihabitans entericus]QIQ21355.1 AraC family transcriptional regulator [Zophobihabitans entericus]
MKMCIACGMPMTSIGDYPRLDISKNYCKHCAREDGSMQSFDERWENLTCFMIREHKMDRIVARETAYTVLKKLPAWKPKR